MPLPRIAIVGRPNVGKSSLMNMLARRRVSIVDPTPGVTRDRVTAVIELGGPLKTEDPKLAEVVDTGGYGVYTAQGRRFNEIGEDLAALSPMVEAQIDAAVETAEIILFVVDAQAGITGLDEIFAQRLRERADAIGDRLMVIANKVDTESVEPHGYEAAAMGLGEPLLVSAKTKHRRRVFREALFAALPDPEDGVDRAPEADPELKVVLVGKRNAGKSTFVNALAGEDRVLVSEIAGTTRDAVDVRFEIDGRVCVAIDTAGLRKRSSLPDRVEWYARDRALRGLGRAHVALMLIDATAKISQVDKQLSGEIGDRCAPCVIVVNKWDLAEGRRGPNGRIVTLEDFQKYIEKELPELRGYPIVFTSAVESRGLREAIDVAFELRAQSIQRIPTGKLNALLQEILSERGPTSRLGTQVRIYYVSQVDVAPPTIVLQVNRADLFTDQYKRYILNRLRERTPFEEVPIRLVLRERRRMALGELKSRGRAGRDDPASAAGTGPGGTETHPEPGRDDRTDSDSGPDLGADLDHDGFGDGFGPVGGPTA